MISRSELSHLIERFGREGVVVELGQGDLPMVRVSNKSCTGQVYLHGAHVTDWTPRGFDPVLFVSARSSYERGKAIRGGVPICFPWFGPGTSVTRPSVDGKLLGVAHGFARTSEWTLAAVRQGPGKLSTSVIFELDADDAIRAIWPHEFHATYTVTFGQKLGMSLEVVNKDVAPFTYESALHTYLKVGDVRLLRIGGLRETEYLAKIEGEGLFTQTDDPLVLSGETDRVYRNTTAAISVTDPTLGRVVTNTKNDSKSTVIWNPWEEKSVSSAGMSAGEWLHMLCVETANTHDHAVVLAPGQKHVMHACIEASAIPT